MANRNKIIENSIASALRGLSHLHTQDLRAKVHQETNATAEEITHALGLMKDRGDLNYIDATGQLARLTYKGHVSFGSKLSYFFAYILRNWIAILALIVSIIAIFKE